VQILARRSPNASRVERWLGSDKAEYVSAQFRDWYGPPVHLLDVPGHLVVGAGGDFAGNFERGALYSAFDAFSDHFRQFKRRLERERQQPCFGAGFTSISDALSRASQGYKRPFGPWLKSGPTGVAASASSLWRVGSSPAAGGAGSAAPGGRAPDDTTTGAFTYTNPSGGTLHLTGADFSASVANNALMLYDRIFDVAKTMNSTATEAVTGVPTRYQSTTATNMDYIGGNFMFVEVGGTALAATAHNWTTCLYADQANASSTLPSVTGVSGAIVDRFDMPINTWFAPLESGDVGVKALTQMQCSALVATGAVNFVIGHPIGIMSFPVASVPLPFDWLTNRDQAPRVFDDACLSLFEFPKPSTTATTYGGMIYTTNAA
jgi:hypothetical protein